MTNTNMKGAKGYYKVKKTGKYKVKVVIEGINKYIGTADTEEAAQKMYKDFREANPKLKPGQKPAFKLQPIKRKKDYDFTGTPWYGL